jgi:hypothetical protein
VCEVETVARGRAFGRQLTTAQRKAIEDRAVKAATEHFETDSWCPRPGSSARGLRPVTVSQQPLVELGVSWPGSSARKSMLREH